VTVELFVVVRSVMRSRPVVVMPTELSLPGHVGVIVLLGARGPGVFRSLGVVLAACLLLLALSSRSFETVGRLVIVRVQVVGRAFGCVRSLRLLGIAIFIRMAEMTVVAHTRRSSLVSVSVPVVVVRSRVLPVWPFPGHRRRRSVWVNEAEKAIPESAVGRRRRAEAGAGRRRREIAMWWWRRRRWVITVWRWRWVVTVVRRRRRPTLAEGWRVREMRFLPVGRRIRMSPIVGVISVPWLPKMVMRATVVVTAWTRAMRSRSMRPMRPMRPRPTSASIE
jgi:hypothetical protein